jgi:hypothetical protein
MSRQRIDMLLQHDWNQLLRHIIAPAKPSIRLRPATLWIHLEDLLLEWRELWRSEWFAADQGELITSEWTLKDLTAHVASWAGELRAQAEILAGGTGVGYQILFDEVGGPRSWNAENVEMRRSQSLEELVGEIERETVRFQDLLFEVGIPALLTERPIGIAATAAPGQPWIRSIAGLVEMRCIHERHHMNRIIQWKRAKLGGDL